MVVREPLGVCWSTAGGAQKMKKKSKFDNKGKGKSVEKEAHPET